jgi:hypothetical protein
MSTSYLYLHLEIDSEGVLRMKLYNKTDDFNFACGSYHGSLWQRVAAKKKGIYWTKAS